MFVSLICLNQQPLCGSFYSLISLHFLCFSFVLFSFTLLDVVSMRIVERKSDIFKHLLSERPRHLARVAASGSTPHLRDQLTCQNITQRVCGYVCVCDSSGLHVEEMATKMELAPLRPWDDFFPGVDRFAKPEFGDLAKWNNRVISNLLYYQTNYFAVVLVVFLIVG